MLRKLYVPNSPYLSPVDLLTSHDRRMRCLSMPLNLFDMGFGCSVLVLARLHRIAVYQGLSSGLIRVSW